jgi:hypothetical protein
MSSGKNGFYSLGQFAPFQQDPVSTAQASDPYIRPQPNNDPFPAAARMRFPQLNNIAQAKIHQHMAIISIPGMD